MAKTAPDVDEMFAQLARCKDSKTQAFSDAWVGIEPTFSNKKTVAKWAKLAAKPGGEDRFFEAKSMLAMVHDVGESIKARYKKLQRQGDPAALFKRCKLEFDKDPWGVERANLHFLGNGDGDDFEVRFGMDPETFEFSIKPVPLVWFRDERFVRFLDQLVWAIPTEFGLRSSIAHGGGQFSFSAKTFLAGSLLADDIATKLNHPELSTWICDYPNSDDRAFRATPRRFAAFRRILEQYWAGAFHPRAIGVLKVENALYDRGFSPAHAPAPGLMDSKRGPVGDGREVFQTNFAFARKVRWKAQNVEPGYWQASRPSEEGYRPDQIMRYSEGNLNRLQIAGELHVKSGKVLDPEDVPEFDAPLELDMLYDEAGWEQRGQMSKTSAVDMVEAVLLDAHHAMYLANHPRVEVKASIEQDQILIDAERTLARRDQKLLDRLRKDAREANFADSGGRIKSDWIEPETLLWASWRALEPGARAKVAAEAVNGFMARVENAASVDPRARAGDPMEWHRHRVHPELWEALLAAPDVLGKDKSLLREVKTWSENRERYLARRPQWSVTGAKAPWEDQGDA